MILHRLPTPVSPPPQKKQHHPETQRSLLNCDTPGLQVEMVMKIEEAFNIELPDERAEEVQNLSDAVRVVTELMDA